MGVTYFGKRAVGNSEIVPRLRNGREIMPKTEARVRAFLKSERKRRGATQ
jgi:hypothetical protein